jgi:Protein of unknown function (DUF3168)
MSPEEAVLARLLAIPAVTAIVGTRIWLVMLPQSPVTPCVRVQQISQIDEGQHQRGGGGSRGWARVQVDAVTAVDDPGNAYDTARDLTEAIHGDGRGDGATGLLGWRGTSDGLRITGVFSLLDAVAEFDPEELQQLRMRRDYAVYFADDSL